MISLREFHRRLVERRRKYHALPGGREIVMVVTESGDVDVSPRVWLALLLPGELFSPDIGCDLTYSEFG